MDWVTSNWQTIVVSVCAVDQFLGVIAPLTPWKFDDRISRILTNAVKSLFQKGK